MFAVPKLVILLIVVAASWVGYRWLNDFTCNLSRRGMASRQAPIDVEDLAACGICGAFVATGAPGCGRPDCPRPR
jgi:hypothetical protein